MKHIIASIILALLILATPTTIQASKTYSVLELIQMAKRSLVRVEIQAEGTPGNVCAGFIVDAAKGWALTAFHCLGPNLTVNGEPSEVVRASDAFGLVKVKVMSNPPLELAKSEAAIGESVVAVGYGYNEFSIVYRHVASRLGGDLALDGPFYPGMSGGPILNEKGEVVGIVQASSDVLGVGCGVAELKEFIKP